MQLSVVIPAYNCGSFLQRSVQSAFALGVNEVEVIVIDDASTDDTPEVCARLVQQYPALRVIRLPTNGGLSVARNSGIDLANGELIMLLDADDEIIPFDVSTLQNTYADMIRIGVEEVSMDGLHTTNIETFEQISGRKYLAQHITEDNLYVPSWAYIYKKIFLKQFDLRFAPNILHEDILFGVSSLLNARSIACIDSPIYRYHRRIGSITLSREREKTKKRIDSLSFILKELVNIANSNADIDIWRRAERVMDNTWSLALDFKSRRLILKLISMECWLFFGYTGWGDDRKRSDHRWRLRRAVTRLLTASA